jgi:hypothetical protein
MKTQTTLPTLRQAALGMSLAVLGALVLPNWAAAQNIVLQNGGSTASINLGNGTGALGMNDWEVYNGSVIQNQLQQQWFWFSINGGAIQSLNAISSTPTLNKYGTLNTLDAVFANSQLSVDITYQLTGGGLNSGGADMTEDIAIDNLTGTAFNINFYQYSHFTLLDTANNSVSILPDGTSGYNYVTQSSGSTAIQEAIDAPDANYAEASNYGQTLAELNGGGPYNLNNTLAAGPGDVTWAFEWADDLGGNSEFDITKDKSLSIQVTPEPATTALFGAGLGLLALVRRRRSS